MPVPILLVELYMYIAPAVISTYSILSTAVLPVPPAPASPPQRRSGRRPLPVEPFTDRAVGCRRAGGGTALRATASSGTGGRPRIGESRRKRNPSQN